MPATEQTWRDSKLLHVIFGISSLAMLGTTIWMLAADHRREWKDYQRKFQEVELWSTNARISQQESDQYKQDVKQAREDWEATRLVVPERAVIDDFEAAVDENYKQRKAKDADFSAVENAYDALNKAKDEYKPAERDRLKEALGVFIKDAKFREEQFASEKKNQAAYLDVARSVYELGVGNELPKSKLAKLQEGVDDLRQKVDDATMAVQDASTYRKRLESIVGDMTGDEMAAKKKLDDLVVQLELLEKARYERENHVTKELVELPILDAFGRPIKIEQIWLPKLTINYNFGPVGDIARFDRCITCHQAMDKTAPGTATEPGYAPEQTVSLQMATTAELPAGLKEKPADAKGIKTLYTQLLKEVYGLQLSEKGLFNADEAMISVVRPETAAAKAQFQVGDRIDAVNGTKILDKDAAYNYLLETVQWGQPLNIRVRRGFPQPYSSHPRLDLFVGSLSPHAMAGIGCTICHDGQGSATSFKWASHSPNDPLQASRWKRDHGWFDNHHWIYPIYPKRFAESLCLKCHHDVSELEVSEKFPDPPAPKLVAGDHLIKQYGCYGCHEINGFDGPNKRIGPDLRTEPNYAAAGEALLMIPDLSEQQRGWAKQLVTDPTSDTVRHSLSESLKSGETLPGQPEVTKKLVNLLDDVESPGKLRKVGPSLRHVASKVDFDFLYSWIRKPSDFRPTTKMPQFFGLHDHLDGMGLKQSEEFEPIEVRAASEYLLAKSQPFKFVQEPKSVTGKASAERGKQLFETRGCLACHQHSDFPGATMNQGPDLSRVGAKLARKGNPDGGKWLYTWLRNPSNYHARTLMPNLFLEPTADTDGKLIDPAADIALFLLGSQQDWEPKDVPERSLDDADKKALGKLALEHLATVFTRKQAEAYLDTGIPESRRSELKGDEVELVGEMSPEKQLQYVGRRTLSKYGCSGCHDIPGFEDAKPIGTGLADWARKTPDKLAFEQIVEFMKYGHGKPGRFEPRTSGDETDTEIEEADEGAYGHTHMNVLDYGPDTGYFMEKLLGHQREGFVWQKLREPRSYDYKKTENKGYNERLRMPKFTAFDDAQRESVITFILGLVAEPPAVQYVYKATPRREAIVQGGDVIEKFNCTGCHSLNMDRWKVAYDPGDFPDPPEIPDYSFLQAHFSPQQIKASLETDDAGLRHTTLVGAPLVTEDGKPLRLDEDGAPIEADDKDTKAFYSFVLWENALINGQARQAGLQNILVPESRIERRYPQEGGFLAHYAYPAVVATEKKLQPNTKADEAWGWLPPPLIGEGSKVQTAWLHDFLLDPFPIRPAVVLRMPKFNMSPAEASKLANYFAAVDNAEYPYDFDSRTRESHLAAAEAKHPDRLDDALKIVTDANYCTKCHLLGDFNPTGSERAKAPRLDQVYKRLRPNFTLDWVANPKRLLPYTGMPVNIPHDKPVSQALYSGTSDEQLNAVVDLLLNYDRFMESKTSIKPLIKPATPEAADREPAGARAGEAAQ